MSQYYVPFLLGIIETILCFNFLNIIKIDQLISLNQAIKTDTLMDPEVYNKTLSTLCGNPQYAKYHEIFQKLEFNSLVYGKYLFVQPPIPGITLSNEDNARNIFSMTFNGFYNEKYNIDPYAYLYSGSDYESDSDEEPKLNASSDSDSDSNKEPKLNTTPASDDLLTMVGDLALFVTYSVMKTNDTK